MDRTVPARAALAEFLRIRRHKADMTYAEMAEQVDHLPSAATLKRAASGARVPTWETVETFVELTFTGKKLANSDMDRARELWIRARRATRAPYYVHTAPDPDLITDRADLSRALRDLHAWAGGPSAREMETAAGRYGELPHTTVSRIISGRILPVSREQTVAYLRACYLDGPEIRRWIEAFMRIGFIDSGLFFWMTVLNEGPRSTHYLPAA